MNYLRNEEHLNLSVIKQTNKGHIMRNQKTACLISLIVAVILSSAGQSSFAETATKPQPLQMKPLTNNPANPASVKKQAIKVSPKAASGRLEPPMKYNINVLKKVPHPAMSTNRQATDIRLIDLRVTDIERVGRNIIISLETNMDPSTIVQSTGPVRVVLTEAVHDIIARQVRSFRRVSDTKYLAQVLIERTIPPGMYSDLAAVAKFPRFDEVNTTNNRLSKRVGDPAGHFFSLSGIGTTTATKPNIIKGFYGITRNANSIEFNTVVSIRSTKDRWFVAIKPRGLRDMVCLNKKVYIGSDWVNEPIDVRGGNSFHTKCEAPSQIGTADIYAVLYNGPVGGPYKEIDRKSLRFSTNSTATTGM